jgi:hypothetical protein
MALAGDMRIQSRHRHFGLNPTKLSSFQASEYWLSNASKRLSQEVIFFTKSVVQIQIFETFRLSLHLNACTCSVVLLDC